MMVSVGNPTETIYEDFTEKDIIMFGFVIFMTLFFMPFVLGLWMDLFGVSLSIMGVAGAILLYDFFKPEKPPKANTSIFWYAIGALYLFIGLVLLFCSMMIQSNGGG